MKDFFISYNRADKDWAVWIAWTLEEAGFSVVVQAWDFLPGGNFVLEMDRAAAECRTTIAVLSPEYLEALYTQPEWAAAFSRDPTGQVRVLIPVRVSPCRLQGFLAQIIDIDLVELSDESRARAALLQGVSTGARLKPERRPGFPGAEGRQKPPFPPETPRLRRPKPTGPPAEPYPFLAPYTHPDTYAGREADLERLKLALRRPIHVLLLYGNSGDGKSSLLTAGLRPALQGQGRSVGHSSDPGREGLEGGLINELLLNVTESPGDGDVRTFVDWIRLVRRLSGRPPVLILDQFEDVMPPRPDGPSARIAGLIAATVGGSTTDEPVCQWVISYRREYHGWVDPWLSELFAAGRFGLVEAEAVERFGAPFGSEDPKEAAKSAFLRAIEKPLAVQGAEYSVEFAGDGAERLAEAFAERRLGTGGSGAPLLPELQVVLHELLTAKGWPHRKELVLEVPEDLPGLVNRALERHLLGALGKLCPEGVPGVLKKRERVLIALYRLTESDGESVRRHPGRSQPELVNWLGEGGGRMLDRLDREFRLVSTEARADEVVCRLVHDRLAEVVSGEVGKDPSLTPDRAVVPLERIVAGKSRQFRQATDDGERRDATWLEREHFGGIKENRKLLLHEPDRLEWWAACLERRTRDRRRGWLKVAASLILLVVVGVFVYRWYRLERTADLMTDLTKAPPGRAFYALGELSSLGVVETKFTAALRARARIDKTFLGELFRTGPQGVAEGARGGAVLAAAGAAKPILLESLNRDVDSAVEEMASVLWALDFFAMRDPSTESQARIIRSGLVEDLRAKRPFQDAIDPAIDHGGGDTRPWAKIEGGAFRFGARPEGRDDRPEIKLSPFWLLKHEVTNAEFARLFSAWGGFPSREPAAAMTWSQAYVFAAWVRGPAADGRLPTEAEWEFAARSQGDERVYPWKDSAAEVCERARVAGCGKDGRQSRAGPLVVCSLPDGNTDQGACDMAGNLGEWTADWYEQEVRGGKDRVGIDFSGGDRVIRGGGFKNPAGRARVSGRDWGSPRIRFLNLGFRVVAPVPPQP